MKNMKLIDISWRDCDEAWNKAVITPNCAKMVVVADMSGNYLCHNGRVEATRDTIDAIKETVAHLQLQHFIPELATGTGFRTMTPDSNLSAEEKEDGWLDLLDNVLEDCDSREMARVALIFEQDGTKAYVDAKDTCAAMELINVLCGVIGYNPLRI